MLVGGVRQHELGDDPHAAPVALGQKAPEVAQRPVGGVDLAVVGDVVAVVAQRRRIEGKKPERRHSQPLQVVELLDQSLEVADAVPVGVAEGPHVELVDDGVLVPAAGRARDDGVFLRRALL